MLSRFFALMRKSRWRLRSAFLRWFLPLAYPGIKCHPTVRFGRGVSIRTFDGGTIEFGAGTTVLDFAWIQASGGKIAMGEDCLVGTGTVIIAVDSIDIGAGTLIAEYVTIRDQDHIHAGDARLEAKGSVSAPIRIGHDVWLAAKVTVTKGVDIAPHAVVGANAVVVRSLPVRGTYGGVPARLLKDGAAASVESAGKYS